MKFSIIHASYGRSGIAKQTFNKWQRTASKKFEYILSFDEGDPHFLQYKAWTMEPVWSHCNPPNNKMSYCINKTNTSVAAINNAAKQCTGDIIIVISDDFEPIPNWDLEILKVVEGKQDWILKTQDGTQPWIITLPIMDRKYYERFGYVYNPAYSHLFCDSEMTHVSDLLGRKITSNLQFTHRHYSTIGGIEKDNTSIKCDKTWDSGKKIYLNNFKNNFGLENVNVWNLPKEAQPHINWLKNELKNFK